MYNRPDQRRISASQVVQFGTGLADPGHGLVMLPIMCGAVWTGFVLARENLFRLLDTVIIYYFITRYRSGVFCLYSIYHNSFSIVIAFTWLSETRKKGQDGHLIVSTVL